MKKFLTIVVAFIACLCVACSAMPEYAFGASCHGVPVRDGTDCPIEPGGGEDEMMGIVKNVLNAIFGIMGVISAVVIIIGGVLYIISAGDPGKVATAKKAILYAVIGLVVSLSAFAITNFILGAL